MDADMDNVYMVTIMANDGTYDAMRMVTVTVTNEMELGRLTVEVSVEYMENGTGSRSQPTRRTIMVGDELVARGRRHGCLHHRRNLW